MQKNKLKNEYTNEILQPAEMLSHDHNETVDSHTELSPKQVEAAIAKRTQMLESVRSSLSHTLAEALGIKIAHEKIELLSMIDADSQAKEAEKKRNKVLEYDFFKKKTLNANSI